MKITLNQSIKDILVSIAIILLVFIFLIGLGTILNCIYPIAASESLILNALYTSSCFVMVVLIVLILKIKISDYKLKKNLYILNYTVNDLNVNNIRTLKDYVLFLSKNFTKDSNFYDLDNKIVNIGDYKLHLKYEPGYHSIDIIEFDIFIGYSQLCNDTYFIDKFNKVDLRKLRRDEDGSYIKSLNL